MEQFLSTEIGTLVLAMVLGGIIGLEREIRDKAVGFRTLILISGGACMYTMFSAQIPGGDTTRVAANIVTGIGFLGAGVIIREGGQVRGLTTASTIWLVAALGMGVGSGHLLFSSIATVIFLIVLWIFPKFEKLITLLGDVHTYRIKISTNQRREIDHFRAIWTQYNLNPMVFKTMKEGNSIILICVVFGKQGDHELVIHYMLENENVTELSY